MTVGILLLTVPGLIFALTDSKLAKQILNVFAPNLAIIAMAKSKINYSPPRLSIMTKRNIPRLGECGEFMS